MVLSKKFKLPTGALVSLNDQRVRIDLPSSNSSSSLPYQSISSAILNGGCCPSTTNVINYKVPSTYNGLDPPPLVLLDNFTKREQINATDTVVGMLTAASMESFAHSSRSAMGVSIDVIVTAGLSNSRSVGADADYFVISEDYNITSPSVVDGEEKQKHIDREMMKPGTINTIIIVNAPLTQSAQVEAYAIAIEAKCSACVDHGVTCAKNSTKYAMGTGTDCSVLISQRYDNSNSGNNDFHQHTIGPKKVVKHAGKHTLFAELIGQAVFEATSKAIMINILHLHYNYATYTMHRWYQTIIELMMMRGGSIMPLIPPNPMMPIPRDRLNVVMFGIAEVLFVYYFVPLPSKAKLLLGAAAWDRYLREPPLQFHPVCIVGSMINSCLLRTPRRVFNIPSLGLICGLALLLLMVLTMTIGAWAFIRCTEVISVFGQDFLSDGYSTTTSLIFKHALKLLAWTLNLLLLKSTFSLQLLCTIALQMAKFIERDQIVDAREQLSWLCSRDPSKLGPSDLAGATLESLSENLSDGFVAPLFWYVLLGPLGALAYRVINTMDSRIGYRGKYEWFGKPSARLDDVINFIPARVTVLLLTLSATIIRGHTSARRGLQTAWKDNGQCESPNAGWPMACFAGLLGVHLKKEKAYCLGASGTEPTPIDIRVGHLVAELAGGICLILAIIATIIMM